MTTSDIPERPSELPVERIRDVLPDQTLLTADEREAMQALVDSDKPEIPEGLFVKYLLPLTYQKSEDNDTQNIQQWRRIAGSVTVDLRVIGVHGQLLFISPGLYPEMQLFSEKSGQSMKWTELAVNAARENDIHPGLGEERLYAAGSLALPTLTAEEHQQHRARWETIWRRYGVNGYTEAGPAGAADQLEAPPERIELDEEDEL